MSEIPAFILEGRAMYRDGRTARILCTDGALEGFPIVSMTPSGGIVTHLPSGRIGGGECPDDLVEIPAEPEKPREWEVFLGPRNKLIGTNYEVSSGVVVHEKIRVVEVPPGWSDPRPPEPTFKPLPPGISTPRQALADALRYYVNNPSAWKCYDQELSDLIKAILLP